MNYQLKFNIKKLNRAFVHGIQGRTEKVECLCIPVSEFYPGKQGELYCTLTVQEKTSPGAWGDTHFAKQQLEKASYNALTLEQRKEIPIIGNMKPNNFGQQTAAADVIQEAEIVPTVQTPAQHSHSTIFNQSNDLPF